MEEEEGERQTGVEGERSVFDKLDEVAPIRERFAGCFSKLVDQTLVGVPPTGPIVEIGAGGGHLFRHLPEDLKARVVLTEPSDLGVRRLRAVSTDAAVVQAGAEALPFEDGSVAVVVGCCVLDVVADLAAVVAEARRVLRPGGMLIHWLDLVTDLSGLFEEVFEGGAWLPLPNVFTDPGSGPWPEDMVLLPVDHLRLVLRVLADDPRGAPLVRYVEAGRQSPFHGLEAFTAAQGTASGRAGLAGAFRAAMERAPAETRARLAALRARPFSSAELFHERLLHEVGDDLNVERAGLVSASVPTEGPSARCRVGFVQTRGGLTDAASKALELEAHVFCGRRPGRDLG